MRKKTGRAPLHVILGGKALAEKQARDQFAVARAQYMKLEGRPAAAWLVFQHRRQIRRDGAIAFFIDEGRKVPRWMDFAFAALRGVPERWQVDGPVADESDPTRRVYIVTWLAHGRYAPGADRRERNARKRLRRVK